MAVKQEMTQPFGSGDQRKELPETYVCGTCHGVYPPMLFDRDCASGPDGAASDVRCSLCDEQAPLSERYWTALSTLAWRCRERGCSTMKGCELGFPSFDMVVANFRDLHEIFAMFSYKGAEIKAMTTNIEWQVPFPDWVSFARIIDSEGDRLSVRLLALEVVNRVRHDLELKYAKEA